MSSETDFIIFCIENYKAYKSFSGKETFNLFKESGVMDYLREYYDVLHTTGYHYINRDIDRFLQVRNK